MNDEGPYDCPLLTWIPYEISLVGATKAKVVEETIFRNYALMMFG